MDKRKKLDDRLGKCCIIALMLCILAYLAVYLWMNVGGFAKFCNPDSFSDTEVAKKMWEEKTIFPETWLFGNQYYVLATPVLAALFYGLTGNTVTAMILATETMTVLILASFYWLLRVWAKDPIFYLTGLLLLLAAPIAIYGPFSTSGMLLFLQASFYACYLITMNLVYGDYLRCYRNAKPGKASLGICLVLCFAMGMQSLRQTAIMILPLIACELFQALRRALQRKKPWEKSDWGRLLRLGAYTCANLSGVVVISRMHIPQYSMVGTIEMVSPNNIGQRLKSVWPAMEEITGLEALAGGDFSRGFSICIFFIIALFLGAAVLWFAGIRKQESPEALCWLLYAVGILGVLLSAILLGVLLRGIYLFMWYPMVAFSGLLILQKLKAKPRYLAVGLACLISLAGLYYGYGEYVGQVRSGEVTDEAKMCQWAMDHNYRYIYADYWKAAGTVAVYSGGEIQVGCWHTPEDMFHVLPYNNPKNIYGEEENARALYIFTPEDEAIALENAQQRGIELQKVAQFGAYTAYRSPEQLMQIIYW